MYLTIRMLHSMFICSQSHKSAYVNVIIENTWFAIKFANAGKKYWVPICMEIRVLLISYKECTLCTYCNRKSIYYIRYVISRLSCVVYHLQRSINTIWPDRDNILHKREYINFVIKRLHTGLLTRILLIEREIPRLRYDYSIITRWIAPIFPIYFHIPDFPFSRNSGDIHKNEESSPG